MDINEARKELNSIDYQIAKLFEKRMDISKLIGNYKFENNISITDSNREIEVINNFINNVDSEYRKDAEFLISCLISASKSQQRKIKENG